MKKKSLVMVTFTGAIAAATAAFAANHNYNDGRFSEPGKGCEHHLEVRNLAPPTAIIGNDFTFTIRVVNEGNCSARNVRVSDLLPAGATYVSAIPTPDQIPSISDEEVVWNRVNLEPGQSEDFQITLLASGSISSVLDNRACARTDEDSNADDNRSCVSMDTVIIPVPIPSPSPSPSPSGRH